LKIVPGGRYSVPTESLVLMKKVMPKKDGERKDQDGKKDNKKS
jgi:hypothetical protein